MDYVGISMVIAAFTFLISAALKGWFDLRSLRIRHDMVWEGIVLRGYAEAQQFGFLKRRSGGWTISDNSREMYQDVADGLQQLYRKLVASLGREPSDVELTWEIEVRYRAWMVIHVCPELGVSQYGCLAIAAVIATENESHQTDSQSRRN